MLDDDVTGTLILILIALISLSVKYDNFSLTVIFSIGVLKNLFIHTLSFSFISESYYCTHNGVSTADCVLSKKL